MGSDEFEYCALSVVHSAMCHHTFTLWDTQFFSCPDLLNLEIAGICLGYKKDDKTIEEVLETNYRIHAGEQSVLHAYVHCSG